MVSPLYLFGMFLIGYIVKLLIWVFKVITNWPFFIFLYKRTNWLYLHILGTYFALTFTNFYLHCFICYWYISTMHWIGYVSIVFGCFLFILMCALMFFCICFKVFIWFYVVGKAKWNDEVVDYMFPHLLARHMI